MPVDGHVWVVILAGGVGSRFWPLSTQERPKQLLPLGSEHPLVHDALQRALSLVPESRIRILAGGSLAPTVREALADLPETELWAEPRPRGTGPALASAAWRLSRLDPDAIMVSLHADHVIEPPDEFAQTVETAVEVAREEDLLVCVGIKPTRVETGYGHLEVGDRLPDHPGAFRIRGFHEKPDSDTARRYIASGFLWNTGIFVWKVSVLLTEIERVAPELHDHMHLLDDEGHSFFDAVPVSVIDRAVMERSDRVATVEASFYWDDVGSWEALSRTREADSSGNVAVGDVRAVQAEGNILFADAGSIVVFGVRDLVVVRTSDLTLVLPRERAPELKTLLTALGRA